MPMTADPPAAIVAPAVAALAPSAISHSRSKARGVSAVEASKWIKSIARELAPVANTRQPREFMIMRIKVGASGVPVDCNIASSSGNDLVDSTACALSLRYAKYTAALDDDGQPIVATVSLRLNFIHPPSSFAFDPIARGLENTELQTPTNPSPIRRLMGPPAPGRSATGIVSPTVDMSVTVGPDGRPTACEVVNSSGDAGLDSRSCSEIMQHAHYRPILNTNGNPTTATIPQKMRFELSGGPQ